MGCHDYVVEWLLFILGSVLPWNSGYTGLEIVIQNPVQAVITILMLGAGISAATLGLISVIKYKERSVLTVLAILSGLYSILAFFGALANLFS